LSSELDLFGIRKIYHTKEGGEEWFMDYDSMRDLERDERVQNWRGEGLEHRGDKIWQATGGDNGQFRLEVWSPKHEDEERRRKARWRNVEITVYCRVIRRTENRPYAWQLYSRGGHHSGRRPCEGSALKARWWNSDGKNSVVKEICHSAYTPNTATTSNNIQGQDHYGNNRWYGSKLVIYNIKDGDRTFTKQEVYTDHDAGDSDKPVIRNNWRKVTEHVDRGGWFASQSCFDSDCRGCGRARDEILRKPGGDMRRQSPNFHRNLIALRTDKETIRFAFFSGREIDSGRPV
jgi:hypothetical protein